MAETSREVRLEQFARAVQDLTEEYDVEEMSADQEFITDKRARSTLFRMATFALQDDDGPALTPRDRVRGATPPKET